MAAAAPADGLDEGLLLSLVSGLGGLQELKGEAGSVFVAHEDALGCLLDLQRFLRRDPPEARPCLVKLASWNVLEGKVLPLLVGYASNFELLFNAAKARRRRLRDSPRAGRGHAARSRAALRRGAAPRARACPPRVLAGAAAERRPRFRRSASSSPSRATRRRPTRRRSCARCRAARPRCCRAARL